MARDWYEDRNKLAEGMIFRTLSDDVVKLDRRVPGDGTKWYVANWLNGWSYDDGTIEPSDLVGEPIAADSEFLASTQS